MTTSNPLHEDLYYLGAASESVSHVRDKFAYANNTMYVICKIGRYGVCHLSYTDPGQHSLIRKIYTKYTYQIRRPQFGQFIGFHLGRGPCSKHLFNCLIHACYVQRQSYGALYHMATNSVYVCMYILGIQNVQRHDSADGIYVELRTYNHLTFFMPDM